MQRKSAVRTGTTGPREGNRPGGGLEVLHRRFSFLDGACRSRRRLVSTAPRAMLSFAPPITVELGLQPADEKIAHYEQRYIPPKDVLPSKGIVDHVTDERSWMERQP